MVHSLYTAYLYIHPHAGKMANRHCIPQAISRGRSPLRRFQVKPCRQSAPFEKRIFPKYEYPHWIQLFPVDIECGYSLYILCTLCGGTFQPNQLRPSLRRFFRSRNKEGQPPYRLSSHSGYGLSVPKRTLWNSSAVFSSPMAFLNTSVEGPPWERSPSTYTNTFSNLCLTSQEAAQPQSDRKPSR